MTADPKPRPFVKMAGGKTALLPELLSRMPKSFGTYHEPFVGGGALYFALRAAGMRNRSVIADANDHLVRTYRAVRSDVGSLVAMLDGLRNTKREFNTLREGDPDRDGWNDLHIAMRFIYLNKTCFNGLYRVNAKGQFNVPFAGYTNPRILDEENLRACSRALGYRTVIHRRHFTQVTKSAKAGDFVYFDPPYLPLSDTSDFTSYTAAKFGFIDQVVLRDTALVLKREGVRVLLSNSDHPRIVDLYKKDFEIERVLAPRNINSKGDGRGRVSELLIR